ncbi:hypothetical protein [Bacillus bombysepticus]|uniref:hypothetical protein n=1 Tax=Bacillus bombysepticus TaxID=658666 RepID=UPI0030186E9D
MFLGIKKRHILGFATVASLMFGNMAYADNTVYHTFELKIHDPELNFIIQADTSKPGLVDQPWSYKNNYKYESYMKIKNRGDIPIKVAVKLPKEQDENYMRGVTFVGGPPSYSGEISVELVGTFIDYTGNAQDNSLSRNVGRYVNIGTFKENQEISLGHKFEIGAKSGPGYFPVKIEYKVEPDFNAQ